MPEMGAREARFRNAIAGAGMKQMNTGDGSGSVRELEADGGVRAVERTIAILCAFRGHAALSITDIAAAANPTKSQSPLSQDAGAGKLHRLGPRDQALPPRFRHERLGSFAVDSLEVTEVARRFSPTCTGFVVRRFISAYWRKTRSSMSPSWRAPTVRSD